MAFFSSCAKRARKLAGQVVVLLYKKLILEVLSVFCSNTISLSMSFLYAIGSDIITQASSLYNKRLRTISNGLELTLLVFQLHFRKLVESLGLACNILQFFPLQITGTGLLMSALFSRENYITFLDDTKEVLKPKRCILFTHVDSKPYYFYVYICVRILTR